MSAKYKEYFIYTLEEKLKLTILGTKKNKLIIVAVACNASLKA